MKSVFIIMFVALTFCVHAKPPLSKKKSVITVKTNVDPNRGKLYLRVYPHGSEECKTQKYDLSKKGSKTITIPERCCWRELRVVEIGKVDKKSRVVGRVTAKESLCVRGKTIIDIRRGKKEKGMTIHPLAIKVQVGKKKKETTKEEA